MEAKLRSALSGLEATLEVVKRNRYDLNGRTWYAKKAREQTAVLKRHVDSVARLLTQRDEGDKAKKLHEEISIIVHTVPTVERKLRALDSIRFLWDSEIVSLLAANEAEKHQEEGTRELFIPVSTFERCPKPIQSVAAEMNQCFVQGCANAASLLFRRLAEMLIEDGYELAGRSGDIKTPEGYVGFSELVGQATSGKVFNLPSPAKQGLKDIQSYGNGAAHSRFFVVKKDDLEKVRPKLRVCFDELGGRCDELRMLRQRGKSG